MPAIASRAWSCLGAALFLFALGSGPAAFAQSGKTYFLSNNLLLSRVVYDNKRSNVVVGMQLPPGCAPANCVSAITDGTYPYVWNNAQVDGSFGITAKIILDQLTPSGIPINSLEVPNSSRKGVPSTADQMVTSFSSKSELALNLSTDGQSVSFMGYLAPVNALDVSNSNTPGVVDPTNPVPGLNYRVVAQINAKGKLHFTATNAYSGNNGRAAILNADDGVLYAAGNAGNGSNPQPNGVILGAGCPDPDPGGQPSHRVQVFRPRSAVSTSPSSATSRTRSARTPISEGSRSSIMSSITRKAAAAMASTPSILSIHRGPTATATHWLAPRGPACRRRPRAYRRPPFNTILQCCRRRGFSLITCAS